MRALKSQSQRKNDIAVTQRPGLKPTENTFLVFSIGWGDKNRENYEAVLTLTRFGLFIPQAMEAELFYMLSYFHVEKVPTARTKNQKAHGWMSVEH